MQSPFTLHNKNIIITGASSGIGKQTAITCSMMGANVLLVGRDVSRLSDVMSRLSVEGNHRIWSIDLTDYKKLEDELPEILSNFGKLNGAVLCAGASLTTPLKLSDPEKLEFYLHTNTISTIQLTRLLSNRKYYHQDGMSIVYISSVMAHAGTPGKTIYSLTKGALLSASRSLALELASKKIRVNTISPGVVVTPMTDSAFYSRDTDTRAEIEGKHPLGLGEPTDVANASVFLLSDAAKWITGTNINVDGGYLAQ